MIIGEIQINSEIFISRWSRSREVKSEILCFLFNPHRLLCGILSEHSGRMAVCVLHRCWHQRAGSAGLHPVWWRQGAAVGHPHILQSWRVRQEFSGKAAVMFAASNRKATQPIQCWQMWLASNLRYLRWASSFRTDGTYNLHWSLCQY